jgi:hypothetical protein
MELSLEAQAAALVNPKSGIANDYLNHFNEVYLMIENLPILLPEMVDELMEWRPVSYTEYFQRSPLPASAETLAIYEKLDQSFRSDFEEMIVLLDEIVLRSVALVSSHRLPDGTIDPDAITEMCEKYATDLRILLDRTADLVNHGYAPPLERPQHMADRLMTDQKKNVG